MSKYIRFKEVTSSMGTEWEVIARPALQVTEQPYLLQLLRNSYITKHAPTDRAQATINRTPTFTLLMPNTTRYKSQRFSSMEAIDKFLDALCQTNLVRRAK